MSIFRKWSHKFFQKSGKIGLKHNAVNTKIIKLDWLQPLFPDFAYGRLGILSHRIEYDIIRCKIFNKMPIILPA